MHKKTKIKEAINLLTVAESVVRTGKTKNDELLVFFKEYKESLNKIGNITLSELIDYLNKIPNKKLEKEKKDIKSFKNSSLDEVEKILEDHQKITKNNLLFIAETRFGIPSGSHKKTRKDELVKIIRNSIDNEKTMNVISDNASK